MANKARLVEEFVELLADYVDAKVVVALHASPEHVQSYEEMHRLLVSSLFNMIKNG